MKKDKSGYFSAFDMVLAGNFDDVPKQYWYYKDFVNFAVSLNGLALQKASVALKNNYEVVENAIKKNPLSIVYASKILQNNTKLKKLSTKLFYDELNMEFKKTCFDLECYNIKDFPYAELKDMVYRKRFAKLTIDELLALDTKTTTEINDETFKLNHIDSLAYKQYIYDKININIDNPKLKTALYFVGTLICLGGFAASVVMGLENPSLQNPMTLTAIVSAALALYSADSVAKTINNKKVAEEKVDPELKSQLGISLKEILKFRYSNKINKRIEDLKKEL